MNTFKDTAEFQKLKKISKNNMLDDPLLKTEIFKYKFDNFILNQSDAQFEVKDDVNSVDDLPALVCVNDGEELTLEMIFGEISWKDIKKYGRIGLTKEWYKNGNRHRVNGPAIIGFEERETGSVDSKDFLYVFSKCWFFEGEAHRKNGPAVVSYYENGAIEREEWYIYDRLHREDGPAIIEYYATGTVAKKTWIHNDIISRTDGPAIIKYYENGLVKEQSWYENNSISSVVCYYKNGNVKYKKVV